MSISVFSVDKLLRRPPLPMDYMETAAATQKTTITPPGTALDIAMHSDGSDTDSKCSSPVNSHNSESLDVVRNGSVSNLSQDILQTMIQSCRRLAANELVRCECSSSADQDDQDRKISASNNNIIRDKCEKCAAKKFNLNLSESYQQDTCNNTIIDSEPVKPVLKFSVSAILSGTKSSCSEERILKSGRNGNYCDCY